MVQKNNAVRGERNSVIPRKATVLLVHEDRDDLDYYGVILQKLGYRVGGYKSYEEGDEVVGSEAFDFIVVGQGSRDSERRAAWT